MGQREKGRERTVTRQSTPNVERLLETVPPNASNFCSFNAAPASRPVRKRAGANCDAVAPTRRGALAGGCSAQRFPVSKFLVTWQPPARVERLLEAASTNASQLQSLNAFAASWPVPEE